jgi:hypothetical protein
VDVSSKMAPILPELAHAQPNRAVKGRFTEQCRPSSSSRLASRQLDGWQCNVLELPSSLVCVCVGAGPLV